MESATFQKGLAEHGCRFDTAQEKRGTGHANVAVHREGRKAELPLGGPHQILDAHIVRRACEELGLDWSELPAQVPDPNPQGGEGAGAGAGSRLQRNHRG
jgi:hypothetical protein